MTRTLRISLLGDVVIQLGDDFVAGLPSRAAEALLIYLVCSPRPVAREKLAELLWAERTTVQALTNLRTVLTALRRELGDYLVVTRQTLAFDRSRDYWLDVAEFERGLAALGPARPTQPDAAQARRLQAVLDLYQGDFLEGFYLRDGQGFEEWATLQRERLRHLAREGLRTLASHQLKTGAYLEGTATAARWRHLDPYSEEACRTFMWLHTRAGQPHLALQCFQHFKALLEVDMGVEPGANTTALFDQLRRLSFPPPLELPPPAVFVGREAELAAVERLLAESDSRLLTLAGPGGIGKTRLAIEAARSLAQRLPGRFLDGVFFIPLAALQSAESIPTQIADWAHIPLQGAAPPGQQVLAYLAGREVLLLLDNVEHLLDAQGTAVNFLVGLLREAPGVKLLLTSRERLSLYDEVIYDVEGLATPQEDGGDAQPAGAALLFLASARRVNRDFSPSAADLGCIARACRLVEGTPLAIELAASWLRHYSCAQIVQQIEHSLDFLASDYRDLPERQRSLRSVFEYSWRLLSAEEQAALAQLSVFASGFSCDAAQALLGPAAPVIDLADKSLLQRQAGARFDLHPLVRSYAAEKLALHPPVQIDITDRHAAYFLDYVTAQGSGESAQQRASLRAEMANIRCAWEWAARRRMVEPLSRAAATLHGFFSLQSWFREGIDLFAQAIGALGGEVVRDAAVAGLRGELLGRKARMHIHIGELAQARADLQQALADLPPFEDAARRGSVLDSLAITHYYAGDYAQAADLARQRLRLAELAGNAEGIGFALNFLGSCAKAEGRYADARAHFQAAAEHSMQRQDEIGAAMVFNNLGNLLQATGDWLGAQRYYQQSGELFKAHDHLHGAATTLANAGRLAGKLGSHQEARALLLESLALKRQMGDARGEAVSLAGLGEVALAAGAYVEARTYLQHAADLAHQAGDLKQMLEIAVAFAALHIKLGQADAAVRLLHFTLHHPGTSQEARQAGEALAGDLAYDWRAASPPAPGIPLDDPSSLLALLHPPNP